ncbi:hypothetical protein BDQ12DRAFT_674181 [Crucibulum laeve]|uniref:Uncharacterized protein n=1 Tax=Crucibulum laeve TaxID=68775 RepID=A0A5C3MMD7_9AGAR|nr:hypothetical protein BDQ12DRAFT_674181 [Crucibulum laeve]
MTSANHLHIQRLFSIIAHQVHCPRLSHCAQPRPHHHHHHHPEVLRRPRLRVSFAKGCRPLNTKLPPHPLWMAAKFQKGVTALHLHIRWRKSTTPDAFTPIPMRERRAEMAVQRSDSWNPPTPTPLRRTTRLMLLDYENEESKDDDDDHKVQMQFRQENQPEEYEEYQQDDETEYIPQRKIRWSLSTSSLPQMDDLHENDFTHSTPKHSLLTPLRLCRRVRNSTHIVLPSISVTSFNSFASVDSNFGDCTLPSRWGDDTVEEYLRRCQTNMIEEALEWIASLSMGTVGWLRGLRLSTR